MRWYRRSRRFSSERPGASSNNPHDRARTGDPISYRGGMNRHTLLLERSRSLGRLVMAVVVLALVATSCRANADVTITDAARTQADAGSAPAADSDNSSPDGNEPSENVPSESSEPETPERDTASGEALFEVRGELPLSTGEVNELIEFIQDDTGRDFLRPPVIVAQSSEEFFAGLSEDVGEFQEDAEITVRSLQSLGLTNQGVQEVADAFIELLLSPDGILGYYDPEPDELYVPVDTEGDDDFRSLLVHELTHALDGQYVEPRQLRSKSMDAGQWRDPTRSRQPQCA